MTKVSNNLSDLKSLLGENTSDTLKSPIIKNASEDKILLKSTAKNNISEDSVLHSYIRRIVKDSAVYDIMRDIEVEGKSFKNLSDSCKDDLSMDVVDYFACCFFEGDYSTLDTLAMNCESGYNENPSANADILGHVVSMTYKLEFDLLTHLFEIALAIDKRMDDEQEKTKYTYKRDVNLVSSTNPKSRSEDHNPTETSLVYSGRTRIESIPVQKDVNTTNVKERTSQTKQVKRKKSKTSIPEQRSPIVHQKVTVKNGTKPKPKPGGYWANRSGIVSFPSMKRESFSAHVASSGVWGKIADYGGLGHLIHINAGHGR